MTVPAPDRPVVLVAEGLSPAALAALGDDVEVREVDGTDRSALLAALPHAAALVVRGATRVDATALAAAPWLRVVARVGVGLENVDVDAATRQGVIVADTPAADAVSTAELAVGLVISAARRMSQAHAALRAGDGQPAGLPGMELYGKTAGILGLGRTGVLVAERLAAFGMQVIAHDPSAPAGRAAQVGVRLVPLDDLMAESDVVSVHLPYTPETVGALGADELARARSGLVLVSTARRGVVDETALLEALQSGRVVAVGLDVDADESRADDPLLARDDVIVTPHLGAATVEAQERAGLAAVRSVRLALAGGLVPDAVNARGGPVADDVRAGLALTERLGRIFTSLAGGLPDRVDVEVRGEITEHDVAVLGPAALTGMLTDVEPGPVTPVNAPVLAAERGVVVRLVTDVESPDHRNLVTLRGALPGGRSLSVSGTLVGIAQRERLVELDGFAVDLEPAEHLAFLRYADRPGVVGTVGALLGEAGINIAGMQVSRAERGGRVLMAMSVDTAVPADVLDRISAAIGAESAHGVDLT